MINKQNKKGLGPLLIILIIGGFLLLGVFGGWLTAFKISDTLSKIPGWLWVILIILLILMLRPKK